MVRFFSGATLALAVLLAGTVDARAEAPRTTPGSLEKVYLQLSGLG